MYSEQTYVTIGDYNFDSKYCIGQGAFGKVYRGNNSKNNKVVAIKEIETANVSEQEIRKEIAILRQLSHPNIVRYEDAFQTAEFSYIVTEYCNGGDLRSLLEDSDVESEIDEFPTQSSARKEHRQIDKLIDMFFQICQGFDYLKQFDIIHRDLKPSNILIHNGVYKIADFGIARTESLHKSLISHDIVGVPMYISPQILSKNYYSYKCDVWSLGVIMFEYYFQKIPWRAVDVEGLFFEIMANPTPYMQQGKPLPFIIKAVFDNTLRYLEKERMSWVDLLALQRKRKKIFPDDTSTKSALEPSQKLSPTFSREIEPSVIHQSIAKHDAEVVSHIICQAKSIDSELSKLVGNDCCQTLVATATKYLRNGRQFRQCFIDCVFFLQKIASENLHLYMMDLNQLQEARNLLILLQLTHDFLTLPEGSGAEEFRRKISNSCRSNQIDQFAASVISKVNKYRLSDRREF